MKRMTLFTATLMAAAFLTWGCGSSKTDKIIALTFDDGPTLTTPKVLDVLQEHDVVGTFFLIGDQINDATAEIMKRTVAQGCEVCNHSKTHSRMSTLTAQQMTDEIAYTSQKIKEVLGVEPAFFRPPYIDVNDLMYNTIELPFICGAGVEDWVQDVTAEERAARVLQQARDGQIVLLHDFEGNDQTVEALKTIIPALKQQGYRFVTVSELFRLKKVTPVKFEHVIYTMVPQTASAQ